MTMPTYEVSGIAIAAVEAETEVDAQRELARRLDESGGQYYTSVCEGIDEALDLLRELGYGRRRAG